MHIKDYFKNHPITYKWFSGSFAVIFMIASLLWTLVILDVEAQYFGDMLLQQNALKWVWLFASVSLLFLSIRIYRFGPIDDYDNIYVKWFGIYSANAALSMAAAYAGVMWAALIPVLIFDQSLPQGMTFVEALKICIYFIGLILVLYLFYLALFVNGNLNKYYEGHNHMKVMRPLLLLFALFFFFGRVLDIVKIFKPGLF